MGQVRRCQIKHSELHFHIPKEFYFVQYDLKIIDHENPESNLQSLCISTVLVKIIPVQAVDALRIARV
jgi:hypothetical protein